MSSTVERVSAEPVQARVVAEPLVVERTIGAPREEVFRAWTETDQLLQWFGPEGFSVQLADVELKKGGRYKIVIVSPAGGVIEHYGVYKEIKAPEKLSFTWMLEDQQCEGSKGQCAETLVTVEFHAIDSSTTQVVLTHELLPGEQARTGHAFGWSSSLTCLQDFVS